MNLSAPLALHARPNAKLNLTLAVGPRSADGFHPLRSVFLRIGLADDLTVMGAPLNREDSLSVSGLPGCPVEGNIALRALAMLREAVGQPMLPLRVQLDKQIPIGAGLGGGSSDAAAALELAARAWGVGLAPEVIAKLALRLGSDVPFFLAAAPLAFVEGRGEVVTALPEIRGGAGALLATSDRPLASGAVYERFDELGAAADSRAGEVTDELVRATRDGLDGPGLAAFAPRLRDANDLWPAATSLAPDLERLRDELERRTRLPWCMSGSGSSLFSLHPSVAPAEAVGRRLAEDRAADLSDVVLYAVGLDESKPAWRQP
jgi:4-diphosphocytidyl-2-C-methyl-D-erythritol kinase